jgi:cell division protein FtsN
VSKAGRNDLPPPPIGPVAGVRAATPVPAPSALEKTGPLAAKPPSPVEVRSAQAKPSPPTLPANPPTDAQALGKPAAPAPLPAPAPNKVEPASSKALPETPVKADPSTSSSPPSSPTPPGEAVPVAEKRRLLGRGYGVAVGMFVVPANADRVVARLTEAGLPVVTDPVESARGRLTRVRVGPFESRAHADAAAVRIRALNLDARVYAP